MDGQTVATIVVSDENRAAKIGLRPGSKITLTAPNADGRRTIVIENCGPLEWLED